ncbi:MAG: cytochrome c biogenesis CcdA family protein [Mycobacteriales bacterium]
MATTIIASFLAGMVALAAPCCLSVMLPAYLATSFRRRSALVAMTFVFAAGLATVMLPIALSVSWVSSLMRSNHFAIYVVGGLVMFVSGVFILAGRSMPMRMPSMRARRHRGPLAVYALGAFSGVASACCAPVVIGVLALAGATASLPAALAVGVAYVFGMVAPLFVLAVLWDRFDLGRRRLVAGRTVTVRVRRRVFTRDLPTVLSGMTMLAIGLLTVRLGAAGDGMTSSGWQRTLSASVQHVAHSIVVAAGRLPGWVSAGAVLAFLLALAWMALDRCQQPAIQGAGSSAARAAQRCARPSDSAGRRREFACAARAAGAALLPGRARLSALLGSAVGAEEAGRGRVGKARHHEDHQHHNRPARGDPAEGCRRRDRLPGADGR